MRFSTLESIFSYTDNNVDTDRTKAQLIYILFIVTNLERMISCQSLNICD